MALIDDAGDIATTEGVSGSRQTLLRRSRPLLADSDDVATEEMLTSSEGAEVGTGDTCERG